MAAAASVILPIRHIVTRSNLVSTVQSVQIENEANDRRNMFGYSTNLIQQRQQHLHKDIIIFSLVVVYCQTLTNLN